MLCFVPVLGFGIEKEVSVGYPGESLRFKLVYQTLTQKRVKRVVWGVGRDTRVSHLWCQKQQKVLKMGI